MNYRDIKYEYFAITIPDTYEGILNLLKDLTMYGVVTAQHRNIFCYARTLARLLNTGEYKYWEFLIHRQDDRSDILRVRNSCYLTIPRFRYEDLTFECDKESSEDKLNTHVADKDNIIHRVDTNWMQTLMYIFGDTEVLSRDTLHHLYRHVHNDLDDMNDLMNLRHQVKQDLKRYTMRRCLRGE